MELCFQLPLNNKYNTTGSFKTTLIYLLKATLKINQGMFITSRPEFVSDVRFTSTQTCGKQIEKASLTKT